MKKFTKGCLITALVLFVFGIAFWGICGVMGGFQQLDEQNLHYNRILSIGAHGIRLGYNGNVFNIWGISDDDFDDDWTDMTDGVNLAETGVKTRTDYQASAITDIDIELGGSNLVIKESEDDYIWISNDSSAKTVKYRLKNGIFKIYYGRTVRFWNDMTDNGTIYLYLPSGMSLRTIDFEMGAGKLESIGLQADEIDLEIGAGKFTIESLQGDEVDISVGAGRADINGITAGTVSVEAGAGDINVENLAVDNLQLEVGMGNINVKGSIAGSAEIECAMGNVDMTLQGMEGDYDYQVECAMGNITIGGNKYSGIIDERIINNGSGRRITIECATGSIGIAFVK